MRSLRQGQPTRRTLRVLLLAIVAAALVVPATAGGRKDKKSPPDLPVCWQDMKRIFDKQPTAGGGGFVFGYVETTLRVQWDPATGIEDEACYPDGHRPIALVTPNSPASSTFLASGCERGAGFVFLASDLEPGVLAIKEVPYSIRGMDFYLSLPEPIRLEVGPSAAVFVGSFRVVAGPLFPSDPDPPEAPTVTLQRIEAPTAAELAAELAPVFDQPWRSYLEALIPPAERGRTHQ